MKKLAIATAATIAAILIAALAAPLLVPDDFVNEKIARLVRDKTGRDLRIAGPIRVSFLPKLELAADDVSLSNPPGTFGSDLLRAKRIEISVRLLPLLHHSIEVDRAELTQPTIHFEIDKQGRRNWIFPRATVPQPTAVAAGNGGSFTVTIADLTIARGALEYVDQRKSINHLATDLAANFSMPTLHGPAKAEGSAIWNGKTVNIALTATSPDALMRGETSATSIRLLSTEFEAEFAGVIGTRRPAKAAGTIRLNLPSVHNFGEWAGIRLIAAETALGRLSVNGKIDAVGSKIALTDSEITLDAIAAQGALSLDRGGARPAISGQLKLDTLDLNPYLKPWPAAPSSLARSAPAVPSEATAATLPQAAGSDTSPHWSEAPIDFSPLRIADADLRLSAKALRFRDIEIGESELALRLKGGELALDLSDMTLYGGSGTGKIIADGSGAVPAVAIRFDLHGIDAGPLLRAAVGIDQVAGKGDLFMNLAGRGRNPQEIISSSTGDGRIELANGKLTSSGLGDFTNGAAWPGARSNSTQKDVDFLALTASGTISDGTLHNNDLKLVAPKMSATGSGAIDLSSRGVQYRWVLNVPDLGSARVLVAGPWEDPEYRTESVTITKGMVQPQPKPPGIRPKSR